MSELEDSSDAESTVRIPTATSETEPPIFEPVQSKTKNVFRTNLLYYFNGPVLFNAEPSILAKIFAETQNQPFVTALPASFDQMTPQIPATDQSLPRFEPVPLIPFPNGTVLSAPSLNSSSPISDEVRGTSELSRTAGIEPVPAKPKAVIEPLPLNPEAGIDSKQPEAQQFKDVPTRESFVSNEFEESLKLLVFLLKKIMTFISSYEIINDP